MTIQIASLEGFNFQSFIVELFLLKYGSHNFTPLRPVKDYGCDGIIESEKTVVACYGPKKYDSRKFNNKAEGDFKEYKENWEKKYSNWKVVVNHDIAPDQIQKVESFKKGSKIIGIQQIVSIIENELKSKQKRKILEYLKISKDYISNDFLSEILNDLLEGGNFKNTIHPVYTKAIYIEDKIRLNFLPEDMNGILIEYEEMILDGYMQQTSDILSIYNDTEKDAIKYRIIRDYNSESGSFKDRLIRLTRRYVEKYSMDSDDEYSLYVRIILIYHFEQCLIGQKVEAEKSDSSSSRN